MSQQIELEAALDDGAPQHEAGRQPSRTFDTFSAARDFWQVMQTDQRRGTWIDPADAATTFRAKGK